MPSLYQQLQHPMTKEVNARDRERLTAMFSDLQSSTVEHFLCLRRYLDSIPEKFFDKQAYKIYLDWLQRRAATNPTELARYFADSSADIDRSFIFLREINARGWHNGALADQGDGSDYDQLQGIDRQIHPSYLRLVEAVFTPLTRPIAYFSRIDRNKGTGGLDTWQIVEELRRLSLQSLADPYGHTIRNGIGHGGITFSQTEIIYQDKRGNRETHNTRAVVRLFDDLLDTCNALAAALKVFFLISRNQGYASPRELLIEELQEETKSPWWTIDGCIESQVLGKIQLIVYARPNSRREEVLQYSACQTGLLSEFFAPGYNRYLIFFQSHKKKLQGLTIFDGDKLRALRAAGAEYPASYKDVLEWHLIFSTRWSLPKVFGKVDTYIRAVKVAAPMALQQVKDALGSPGITCRNSSAHRNSWGCVLRADIVISGLDDRAAMNLVRKNRGRLLRLAKRHARRENRLALAAYLPIGFAQVNVFRRDYRARRLSSFGLGDDLVCTVRRQRIRRIKAPDILRSTVEVMGTWRIAWNEAWLKAIDGNESA